MKPTRIKCEKCDGKGIVSLPEKLQQVLSATTELGITATEARARLDCTVGVTAFNNRLNRLCSLGLMSRKRQGIDWVYFRKAN